MHSHTHKPLIYKIAGVWGNHEGSMLLWVLILTGYGAAMTWQLKSQNPAYHLTFPLLGLINAGFLLFILMGCDSFTIVASAPLEGQDMNPLLQDPSLAIHPPILYLGMAGFAVPFVFAACALLQGKIPEGWAGLVYPWALFAWAFLTLGLGLGSYWAYYELGWGGWWFWDPVENAALMPWLAATALVHALRSMDRTGTLKAWALCLCILTFALCLFGIFLVRSGLLTSVHSFAVDPERGIMILILSCFLVLPVLGLFVWRLPQMQSVETIVPFSRPSHILLMTLLLTCGVATIAIGTVYPLAAQIFNLKITVGEPYFRATFVPMMLPLLFLMGFAPWPAWGKDMPFSDYHRLIFLMLITALSVWGVYFIAGIPSILGVGALAGGIWIILTTIHYAIKNSRYFSGMAVAHIGIGIAVLGMAGSNLWEQEVIRVVKKGEPFEVGPCQLVLQDVHFRRGANYQAQQANFLVKPGGAILAPEKRHYWTQGIIHGEAAIQSVGLHHIYLTLGQEYEGRRWSIHAYYKPFINLLWIGGLLCVMGGFIAFIKRLKPKGIPSFLRVLILLAPGMAEGFAFEVHEQVANPLLEKRARSLSQKILCPQCQGQLLDESPIAAAADLRRQIRASLLNGETDQEILNKFVDQFGPQIITRPPLNPATCILWFAPWVIFMAAVGKFIISASTAKGKKGYKK